MPKESGFKSKLKKHADAFYKLIAYLIILSLFLAAYIPFALYMNNDRKEAIYQKTIEECNTAADSVYTVIDDVYARLDVFASLAQNYEEELDSAELSATLKNYYTTKEMVDGIAIIRKNPQNEYEIANDTKDSRINPMPASTYYEEIFKGKKSFRYTDSTDLFSFTAPIKNDNGEIFAIIESTYTREHCVQKLTLANSQKTNSTFLYHIDTGLTMEIAADKEISIKYTEGNFLGSGTGDELIVNKIERREETFSIKEDIDGEEYFLQYALLENGAVYVGKYLKNSEVLQEYKGVILIFILIGVIVTVLITGFFVFALIHAYRSMKRNSGKLSELELLTERLPCAILWRVVDERFSIISYSDGLLKNTGYTKEEITNNFGDSFLDVIYEADRNLVINAVQYQSEVSDEDLEIEYRIVKKDGNVIWVRDRGKISVGETGEKHLFSVLLDITESRFANEQLASKTKDLKSLMQILPSGMIKVILNDGLEIDTANPAFYKLCGYNADDFRNNFNRGFLGVVDRKDREKLMDILQTRGNGGEAITADIRINKKGGKLVWLSLNAQKNQNSDGETELLCVLTDITSLRESYNQAKLDRERYRTLSSMSSDIIFEYNLNENSLSFMGTGPLPLPPCIPDFTDSQFFKTVISEKFAKRFEQFISVLKQSGKIENAEISLVSPRSGNPHWFALFAYSITAGDSLIVLGKLVDIHQQKMEIEALKEANKRDALTGLYNKTAAKFCINHFLEKEFAQNSEHQHALMVLDVDNFKSFNDSLGHITGDTVLIEISKEISSLFRSRDIIGRVGGDEFVLFIKDFPTIERMAQKAKEICESFEGKSFVKNDRRINVSVSIGIALVGKDGLTYDELFEKADEALYEVKKRGKNNFAFYDK